MKGGATVRKKAEGSLLRRQNRYGWLFTAPLILGLLVVYFEVIWDSLRFSFHNIVMQDVRYTLDFAGFDHYVYLFRVDTKFLPALFSSLGTFLGTIPVIVIFSLFAATLLNQKMHGRGVFRAIFFVPVVLSTGLVLTADSSNLLMDSYQQLSGVNTGLSSGGMLNTAALEEALSAVFVGSDMIRFVIDAVNGIYDVVNQSGVQIVLFLAGLQSISPAIYEAAYMEGASGWEVFWKITFPLLGPVILINSLYSAINIFTTPTNPIMQLIVSSNTGNYDYGTASAMAWTYFLLIGTILLGITLIARRRVFYQEG